MVSFKFHYYLNEFITKDQTPNSGSKYTSTNKKIQ